MRASDSALVERITEVSYDASIDGDLVQAGRVRAQDAGPEMIDRGLVRPLATARAFAMEGETFEIPSFENAEGLVDRLVRRGLLAGDELVELAAEGRPRAISIGFSDHDMQTAIRHEVALQAVPCRRPSILGLKGRCLTTEL